MDLSPRSRCPSGWYYDHGYCYRGSSSWHRWGRWVCAAIVIAVFFLLFLGLLCLNSRRRKRRGLSPYYGTGWMAPGYKPGTHQNNGGTYAPPPQYSPGYGQYQMGPYGNQGNQGNQGHYGGQQEGVQAPPNAYYGPANGNSYYAPPEGPPPPK